MTVYKTIWISDVHLGTKGCKSELLCNFLKNNNCDNLFLVGDIIDGWKLQRKWYWPQEHSNVLRKILTKAKRGTIVTYIIGNHDEFLRSWTNTSINVGNIEITNEKIYTDLKGRTWLIIHGDLFDQITVNFKWLSMIGDRVYSILLICNSVLHQIRSKFGLGYWSLSKYLKEQSKQAVNFIYKFEEHLAEYAKSKKMQGVISGHIHKPEIKSINNITYMNTGDWVESCSVIVETLDGEIQLLVLNQNNIMDIVKTL